MDEALTVPARPTESGRICAANDVTEGGREGDPVLRVLIPYTLFWVRLGYRIWHSLAYWLLRLVPMPPVVRHHLAGAVALIPYWWIVWGFTAAFDFTWRADVIAGLITAGMLLIVYRVEVARAR